MDSYKENLKFKNNYFVIISGAGPAGLTLANLLEKLNLDFLIIDHKDNIQQMSKATGIRPATLKLFQKINLLEEIYENSLILEGHEIIINNKISKQIIFENGKDKTDKNLSLNQKSLENILYKNLILNKVNFGYKLENFEELKEYIKVKIISKNHLVYNLNCNYLIACDGAKSTIRKKLGFSFEGQKTPELSFTFDGVIKEENTRNKIQTFISGELEKRIILIPIPDDNKKNLNLYKFSGKLDDSVNKDKELIELFLKNKNNSYNSFYSDDLKIFLKNLVENRSNLNLDENSVRGLTFYHTASRMSNKFCSKRIFLVGDAAHIFFPAGGYGINTAIEEAFNISWRLLFLFKFNLNLNLFYEIFNKNFIQSEMISYYDIERRIIVESIQSYSENKKISLETESIMDEINKEIGGEDIFTENESKLTINNNTYFNNDIENSISNLFISKFMYDDFFKDDRNVLQFYNNFNFNKDIKLNLENAINNNLDFKFIIKLENNLLESVIKILLLIIDKFRGEGIKGINFKIFILKSISMTENNFCNYCNDDNILFFDNCQENEIKYVNKTLNASNFLFLVRPDNNITLNIFSEDALEFIDLVNNLNK